MQLLKDGSKDGSLHIYNGDPRKWLPGMYRSLANHNRIVIVIGGYNSENTRTVIVVTSTEVHNQVGPVLSDGYLLLPKGETITIEA